MRRDNGPQGEISGSQLLGNAPGGVFAQGNGAPTTTTATVSDSVISGGYAGISAYAGIDGATAKAFVTRSTIDGTSYALACETNDTGTAILVSSGNTVVNNFYGWYRSGTGSLLRTLGNNHITDNASTFGAVTPAALQ